MCMTTIKHNRKFLVYLESIISSGICPQQRAECFENRSNGHFFKENPIIPSKYYKENKIKYFSCSALHQVMASKRGVHKTSALRLHLKWVYVPLALPYTLCVCVCVCVCVHIFLLMSQVSYRFARSLVKLASAFSIGDISPKIN